jgi:HSP20 family molecular chaperone IbpA
MKWDLLLWQRASELMERAERIQMNLLQAAASEYLAPSSRPGAWAPSVNLVETDQAWWVITAVPGAEPSQIDIRLEGDELIIAGTCSLPPCCTQGELAVWEISLGRFERRLSLIPGVRFTIAERRFKEGLLIMQLKKSV